MKKLLEVPQDRKAEGSFIGSLMLDPDKLSLVRDIVSENHFVTYEARDIYKIIVKLSEAGEAIDGVLVHSRFPAATREELFTYMCAAMDTVPSAANLEFYAQRLHDKYVERELASLIEHGKEMLHDELVSVQEKIEAITTIGSQAGHLAANEEGMTVADMIGRLSVDLTAGGLKSVSTGLNALDRIIGGVGAGQLILVAGATSMGKTSLLLDLFIHLARVGQRPYYYYLEMLAAHLGQRLVQNIARVPRELVEAGAQCVDETRKLTEDWPAWIEPKPVPSIAGIIRMIAAQKAKRDIGAVFIDHIQKINAPGRGSVEQISYVSNALSLMACDLKIPVICACHVNRETLHRENHIPKLSDLRGSGSLENDSDVVMILHREDYYREQKEENPDLDGEAQCYILKNRQGPKGIAQLIWLPEYCSFSDRAHDDDRKLPF